MPSIEPHEIDELDPEMREALFEAPVRDYMATVGVDRETAEFNVKRTLATPSFKNSRYIVRMDVRPGQKILHLDIRRRDKGVPGPERWRDFQRIKNELVGPEYEACELYPRESRMRDAGNNFHLWVLPQGQRFNFGFDSRVVVTESTSHNVQAPFEPDDPTLARERTTTE